jgi:hypothetical protein
MRGRLGRRFSLRSAFSLLFGNGLAIPTLHNYCPPLVKHDILPKKRTDTGPYRWKERPIS